MNDSLSPEVATLLQCPVTGQKLRFAEASGLTDLHCDLPEGGWITEDNARVYPIRDGFPVLVPHEAVEVSPNA